MSDSSNQPLKEIESFDPEVYFKKLCINTKIQVFDYSDIEFPIGWKSIIETFIQSIKSYPIIIQEISDSHFMLNVKFETVSRTREVNVWRAIDVLRKQSTLVCAGCGDNKRSRSRIQNPTQIYCEVCLLYAGKTNITGTWLDKY